MESNESQRKDNSWRIFSGSPRSGHRRMQPREQGVSLFSTDRRLAVAGRQSRKDDSGPPGHWWVGHSGQGSRATLAQACPTSPTSKLCDCSLAARLATFRRVKTTIRSKFPSSKHPVGRHQPPSFRTEHPSSTHLRYRITYDVMAAEQRKLLGMWAQHDSLP